MQLLARPAILAALALVAATAACGGLNVRNYPTPLSLYGAGLAEYQRGKWDNAITALDRVAVLLPPRDTLLPPTLFLLGNAYVNKKSHLLASATFKRLFEDFPDDSLADNALLAMADAEAGAWRGPEFDAQPAIRALESYSLLPRLFAESSLIPRAREGEARMQDGLARRDLMTGVFYMKRGALESSLIYFRDASQQYPGTPAAREAMLKMVEIYRQLKWLDDAGDICTALRAAHATDPAVLRACAGLAADSTG
jgi:outer membrane protein assembly factor BamD